MTDLLATGSKHLADTMEAFASKSVTYKRGDDSVVLNAVLGRSDYEQELSDGGAIRYSEMDFIIRQKDLVLAGSFIVPEVGDRIEVSLHSALRVFRVQPTTGFDAHFSYTTPQQDAMRVRTKLISAQDASPAEPTDDPGGGV